MGPKPESRCGCLGDQKDHGQPGEGCLEGSVSARASASRCWYNLLLDSEDSTLLLPIGGSELYAAVRDDFVGNAKTG